MEKHFRNQNWTSSYEICRSLLFPYLQVPNEAPFGFKHRQSQLIETDLFCETLKMFHAKLGNPSQATKPPGLYQQEDFYRKDRPVTRYEEILLYKFFFDIYKNNSSDPS